MLDMVEQYSIGLISSDIFKALGEVKYNEEDFLSLQLS